MAVNDMISNFADSRFSDSIARTPTVLQMEAAECGVACLSMILEYHKLYIPLEKLRLMCGVSRDGCKLSNIARAARRLGFHVEGYKVEPIDLLVLKAPSIIHWDFDHFVVFEGMRNGKAYINDPSYGPRLINLREFDQLFTGVMLEFQTNSDFKPGGNRVTLAGFLKNRLEGVSSALIYLILSGLFFVPFSILAPAFYRIFIDNILINQQLHWYKPLIVVMLITAVIQASVVWLQKTALLLTSIKATIYNTGSFFYHLLRLPAEFFGQRYAGDIGSRFSLNDRMANIVFGDLSSAVLNVIFSIFLGIVMFFYNVPLALITMAVISLNFIALKHVSRKISDINQRLECEYGKMAGNAMKGLQIIETLKSTGSEQEFFEQISGHQAKVINASSELNLWTQILSSVSPFLSTISSMLIFLVGGIFIIRGRMTIGMLIGFEMLAVMLISEIGEFVGFGGLLQETKATMKRLDDVISYGEEERYSVSESKEEKDGEPKLTGSIELRGVTFGYSRLNTPLIRNFNLKIEPCSRVALVGVSGSGKTTIAKLIMGLYEPWEGQILVGGRPLKTVSKELLANSMAMVGQGAYLFKGSVKDNISMWDNAMEEGNIIAASKDAFLDDVIMRRHGEYDSPVGENGDNFSGGERQRLEIATTLAINPSFLILDEATSALDTHSENIVSDNIKKRGLTCLISAHRLSTIRDCDEIIVLHNGSIVQRGTHEELSSVSGVYADMIKAY